MSRYCKKQGQVLSDTHFCETCPPIDRRTPPYARQALPGEPIELIWGNEPPLVISDSAALLLVHQLSKFVMGNIQAKARAK